MDSSCLANRVDRATLDYAVKPQIARSTNFGFRQIGGWNFIRVRFKIWPGQGNLIETTFRQQIVSAMKTFHANYADWQVPVTYRAASTPKSVKSPPDLTPDKSAA